MRMESMLMIDALPSEKGHADSTASVAFASSSPRWHSHLPDQLDRPDRACAEPAGLCDASNPCEQHSPRVGVADVLRGVLVLLHQRQDRGRLRRSGLAATLLRDRFGLLYRWRRWGGVDVRLLLGSGTGGAVEVGQVPDFPDERRSPPRSQSSGSPRSTHEAVRTTFHETAHPASRQR